MKSSPVELILSIGPDATQRGARRTFLCVLAAASLLLGALGASIAGGVPEQRQQRRITVPLSELKTRIQAKLDELRTAAEFPGATVGYTLPGGQSDSVSTGLADLEARTPLKPGDRMLAGSIGKTFVAAVILMAVEERRLDLDAKIERWFGRDSWFERLPNSRDLTLRMLMNHSSGIPEHVLDKKFLAAIKESPYRVWKPEELVSYILDAKPLFPAGQGFSYADTNYILAGMIFERGTGKAVYGEVTRRLLKPFKLADTIPSDKPSLPGVIPGYSMPNSPFGLEGRTLVDGRFVFDPQMEWCGGGFASTAGDLARWADALYGGKVLSPASMKQMVSGVEAREGRGGGGANKYGLGVQIRPSDWGTGYGHGGWFPGYLSEMEYFPDYKVAVAVQFNTDFGQRLKRSPRAYIAEIMKIIAGVTAVRRPA
jgi:D-alanyl-D-alanine carboxypeptidase